MDGANLMGSKADNKVEGSDLRFSKTPEVNINEIPEKQHYQYQYFITDVFLI